MDRIAIVDCETGGLVAGHHTLISVAAMKVTQAYDPIDSIELFIQWPEYVVTQRAMEVNRIDIGDAKNWLKPRDAAERLFDFLEIPRTALDGVKNERDRWRFVGKNPEFDKGFLKHFLGEVAYDSAFMHWTECVLKDMYNPLERLKLVPVPTKRSLGDLCKVLKIEVDDTKLHGAAYDVEMTRLVAKKLYAIEQRTARDLAIVRKQRAVTT
jgi:DNA polymerase III alpha subunit (gram-positive type)